MKNMKKDSLTKQKKKSIIHGDGRLSILGVRNFFRRFKKIISSSLTLVFKPHKGGREKVVIMTKKFFSSFGGNGVRALMIVAALVTLAACGGGGSSSVTPPPPVNTCSNGALDYPACTPPVSTGLHYDVTLTLWDGGYPYKTTKTGRTMVINKTSFAGVKPFISCGLSPADKKEADGHVQVKCTAIIDNKRYVLAYNGETNEFTDFAGVPLADDQFTLSETNSTTPVAGSTSAHSDAEGGWLYANPNSTPVGLTELDFKSDANGAVSVVEKGTFGTTGTIKVIRNYKR